MRPKIDMIIDGNTGVGGGGFRSSKLNVRHFFYLYGRIRLAYGWVTVRLLLGYDYVTVRLELGYA